MKYLITVFAVLFSVSAFAGNNQNQNNSNNVNNSYNTTNDYSSHLNSTNTAVAGANSSSTGLGVGVGVATVGDNTAVTGDSNASASVNAPNVLNQNIRNQRQVPMAWAPPVTPTAPCMGSTSAGGSGVNIGLSFGTTWEDKECSLRETARYFSEIGGDVEDAIAILCTSKYAKAAKSCKGKEGK
jgi:hypothetical protein